jgi:phosphomannomutase
MNVSDIKFGANGWRAKVGSVFTEENLIRVAEAFSRYLLSKNAAGKTVAVGYDGRAHSKQYAEKFSNILSVNGITVFLSDAVIPTPMLSFAVRRYSCAAGIMVTASHNPPSYNGVKFKAGYGGPFLAEETEAVHRFLNEAIENRESPDRVHLKNFLPEYIDHLKTIIDFSALQKYAADPANTASVMIDSMGGAGKTILEDILVDVGWRAQTIFGTPEENFYDRLPEPIGQNLAPLMYNTEITDAILGIATDGDADRCSIIYEDGAWMTAQENILALLWHLHKNKKWSGAVIKSASVSDKVRVLAEQWHQKVYDVNVGFSNVTDVMLREQFMFGAEESGGFGFQHHIPERDGILSGLMFCEMIAMSGKSLREIWKEITASTGDVHYGRIDIPGESIDREEALKRCEHYRPSDAMEFYYVLVVRKYHDHDLLNGIKYSFGDSRWLLVRISQTESMIRIYAEGRNDEEVKLFLEEGKRLVGVTH